MLDLRLKEHTSILNQLQKHLGSSLYDTRISVDTHIRESQTMGMPITYSMPTSRGTLQYKNLAQEVIDDLGNGGHVQSGQPQSDPLSEMEDAASFGKVYPNDNSSTLKKSQKGNLTQQNPVANTNERATLKPSFNGDLPRTSSMNRQAISVKCCPQLGDLDDPQTMSLFPSVLNRCYRSKPVATPNFAHQTEYCISDQYQFCPMFKEHARKRLPPNLRAPTEISDFLRTLKDWVQAKIF